MLLDRSGAASGSSGATHTQIGIHNRMPGLGLDLTLASMAILGQLPEELGYDVEYHETGNLMLLESEDQLDWANERRRIQAAAGIRSELWTRAELVHREPFLGRRVAAAIFYPQSIRVNSMRICHAMALRVTERGGGVHLYSPATSIVVRDGKVQKVQTPDGDIATSCVINAAGPWAGLIGAMAGVNVPLTLNKGHVVITEKTSDLGVRMKGEVILHDASGQPEGSRHAGELEERYGVRFVFTQTDHGNCLIGRSGEEFTRPHRREVQLEAVQAILTRAVQFMPALRELSCIRVFAGFRPYSPDQLPMLGPAQRVQGLVVAAGHGDRGIGYMCTGKMVADYLCGRAPELPLGPLAFSRFEVGAGS